MIISVAIEKGGTGKSQTAITLSSALVRFHGKKVLVIDLDPQGTASLGLGINPLKRETHAIHEVLEGKISPEEAVYSYNDSGLCIIPARSELAVYGSEDFTEPFSGILKTLYPYFDYILIDLPPTIGTFTMVSLALSDRILIPFNASSSVCVFALISQLETVHAIISEANKKLRILGILPCIVNKTKICLEILDWLEKEFGDLVFQTKIRENVRLAEAMGSGQVIFDYSPDSPGAEDYKSLSDEFMERVNPLKRLEPLKKLFSWFK